MSLIAKPPTIPLQNGLWRVPVRSVRPYVNARMFDLHFVFDEPTQTFHIIENGGDVEPADSLCALACSQIILVQRSKTNAHSHHLRFETLTALNKDPYFELECGPKKIADQILEKMKEFTTFEEEIA